MEIFTPVMVVYLGYFTFLIFFLLFLLDVSLLSHSFKNHGVEGLFITYIEGKQEKLVKADQNMENQ